MQKVKTPIIPQSQTFVKIKGEKHELDYKAICLFGALGFFLDTDTYWKDQKVLPPATINTIDDEGYWLDSKSWFEWYNKPRDISLQQATNEFKSLFEGIVKDQSENKKVILALSGGLDSRSQTVALKNVGANVNSYSYSFQNGYKESKISKKISKISGFPFKEFIIPKGYLWEKIEELSNINHCYAEFTHPRQMAIVDEFSSMGDAFSLGHWGDVLFDSDHYDQNLSNEELVSILKKKVIKKGGLYLANALWKDWNIEGDFEEYLDKRFLELLSKIKIDNINTKVRAFKSLYWAPRWTSINLSIFESQKPIFLPYYDDRMCQFICELPEELLANRQIQIEYIKQNAPKVAKVVWQDAKPFNLFNHHLAKFPYNFPYRLFNKGKRVTNDLLGKKFVQRNWELQFLGENNQKGLEKYLCDDEFNQIISRDIITNIYDMFKHKDSVFYSHSVSMLLTLSLFCKNHFNRH